MDDEIMHALLCAKNLDLWQEEDGSTREYAHKEFGFSDFVRDLTGPATAAAEAGLIELRGARRRWAPTEAGEELLTRTEQELQR